VTIEPAEPAVGLANQLLDQSTHRPGVLYYAFSNLPESRLASMKRVCPAVASQCMADHYALLLVLQSMRFPLHA
jgi:hypothetical protein